MTYIQGRKVQDVKKTRKIENWSSFEKIFQTDYLHFRGIACIGNMRYVVYGKFLHKYH